MGIKESLSNIFSITHEGEMRFKITFFGIRFKCLKWTYLKKRLESPYCYYKKNNIDITQIPKAQGQVRDIQLANLALLKELDYVCKENNLQYWIDFGTLLGAIRHKGFIPWDDDIDTGMLREDYNKIVECFNKTTRNPDIYAEFTRCNKKYCIYYVKIRHKKCDKLFVDIFPYDFYGECLDESEQYKITKEIKGYMKEMRRKYKPDMPDDKVIEIIKSYSDKVLVKNKNADKSDLIWGIDFKHHWKNWLSNYDSIFPLKEADFEGIKFPCVNDPNAYLTKVYGDYMAYPKKIGVGHKMFEELTNDEKTAIEDLKKGS